MLISYSILPLIIIIFITTNFVSLLTSFESQCCHPSVINELFIIKSEDSTHLPKMAQPVLFLWNIWYPWVSLTLSCEWINHLCPNIRYPKTQLLQSFLWTVLLSLFDVFMRLLWSPFAHFPFTQELSHHWSWYQMICGLRLLINFPLSKSYRLLSV